MLTINEIVTWSKGNPGALDFLTHLTIPNFNMGKVIIEKLNRCKSIRGANIYVLYSDLCKRDIKKVYELCEKCPDDILEDACNRQDYSGLDLIKDYISINEVK